MLENVGQTPTLKISHLKRDLETAGKGRLRKYLNYFLARPHPPIKNIDITDLNV